MSGKSFPKDFYLQFDNYVLSGKLSVGLVKIICLPDRMSGKNLNTFANTAFDSEPASHININSTFDSEPASHININSTFDSEPASHININSAFYSEPASHINIKHFTVSQRLTYQFSIL